MQHFCLITTLDVAGRNNNREHNVIRAMAQRFDRVSVVFRRRAKPGAGLRAMLTSQRDTWREGNITYIAVDPPLNPPEGMVKGATTHAPRASALRKSAGRALDLVAMQKDHASVRALTAAAAMAVRDAPDSVVQAMGPWAARAAETLRARGLIRAYCYVDRDFEPGFVTSRARQNHAARAEARAARSADLTLCIGHRLAARAAPHAGDRLQLSPTGVDLSQFARRAQTAPKQRLVYIGEVADWACIDMALGALAQLRADFPALELHVMGPSLPAQRDHLLQLARTLGVADAFHWPGARPRAEAIALMAGGGIGLAVFQPTPLRIHAAPLKVVEYMASGLPTLTTQGSEAGDLITRTGAGSVITPGADAIANATRALLSDPDNFAAKSHAALTQVEPYDWSLIMAREYDMMRALSDAPGATAPASAATTAECTT